MEAHRLAACTDAVAVKNIVPRSSILPARQTHRLECQLRSVSLRATADSLATAAPADVSEEAAASRNKDSNEDDFPDVSPDSLAAFPPTDKYAVVDIGGVQMFVQEGRWYSCNRLEAQPGQNIKLGRVLAVKEDGKFNIGAPYLENATVKAEVVDEMKGEKVTIFKMRRKKHYRRKTGHRQPLTQFLITEIKL